MAERSTLPFLVVEDNPIHRDLLTNFLTAKGYNVEEASNGAEALEKLKAASYHFILMDLLMPGMDGFETVQRIRQMGIDTPIIVQSSLSMKQDRERCLKAGSNGFVPKPIDLKELWKTILKHERTDEKNARHNDDARSGEEAGISSRLAGKKVLVVEEDDGKAEWIKGILEYHDLEVIRTETGSGALDLLQSGVTIDIVVSNIFTSGIDGLGLSTMMKRRHPDTLIFLYTGKYDSDTFQLAVRQGAHGIVTEASFEHSIPGIMESALYERERHLLRSSDEQTARQVRQSQAQLYRYGYDEKCSCIDITTSTLHDAGGDIVLQRRFNRAGRYGVIIADVAGHDVRSSYISAIFLGIISSIWDSVHEPSELVRIINREILKLKAATYHVCVTALLWDQRRGRVDICSAGNPGGLLVRPEGDGKRDIVTLEGGGMCLGMLTRNDLYVHETIELREGEHLFFHSDGVERDVMVRCLEEHLERDSDPEFQGFTRKVLGSILSRSDQEDDIVIVGLEGVGREAGGEERMSVRSTYDGVNEASEWLAGVIGTDDLPSGVDRDFFLLSVREALLNAVEHGNAGRDDAWIDLDIYRKDEELRIEISDEGMGFDIREKLRAVKNGDGMQVGRRGLPLMNSFAERITVEGGTVILSFRYKNGDTQGGST